MSSLADADNLEADTSNSNGVETVNGVNGAVNGTSTKNNGSANDDFDDIDTENEAKLCTLEDLLKQMLIRQHDSTSDEDFLINLKCKVLFEEDYIVEVVENTFTSHYPKNIIVPLGKRKKCKEEKKENVKESETSSEEGEMKSETSSEEGEMKSETSSEEGEISNLMEFDKDMYIQLVKDSLIARLRSRFVAPVILFDNKFICRSGTLTVWTSALYEKFKPSFPTLAMLSWDSVTNVISSGLSAFFDVVKDPTKISSAVYELVNAAWEYAKLPTSYIDLNELYAKDVEVLEHLKVERIFDLMVEYNKHYRNAVNVSSTEKVNALYEKFKVEEMPYPGCEFFATYSELKHSRGGLLFDWKQSDVTRTLVLTENPPQLFPDMDIKDFKRWDLVKLTQNYLKIMLSYVVTGTGGIVVHCISGWDRTPLFVSLIRLSLWADGLIHESLKENEMAYLTVAYDWFLFGHNLPDRHKKREEIMYFFFEFMLWMTSDEFSATRMFQELPTEKKRNRTFPEFVPERRKELLLKIREIFKPCSTLISAWTLKVEENMPV